MWLRRAAAVATISWWLAGIPAAADPAVTAPPAAAIDPITEPGQAWALSNEQKSIVHPLRLEGRVSYVDRRWRHLWLEKDGLGSYLLLSTNPPPLRQGQHVLIEGTILPVQGLDADTVTVKVLQDYEPVSPLDTAGRIGDIGAFNNRIVTAQAYVDGQQMTDDDHVHLFMIVDDQPVTGWVKPANPHAVPTWAGSFIRMTGMYQGRFDPTQTQLTIELWTADPNDVTIQGSVADSHRFDLPVTPIKAIHQADRDHEIRVRGHVVSAEPGSFFIVRDETGQLVVQSVQEQRIPAGTEIEAIGRATFHNAQWVLGSGLVRIAQSSPDDRRVLPPATPAVLERVDQIRQLSVEEAAQGRPVVISGAVTFALPGDDIFFLQDISGGIRVRYRRDQMETPPRSKYLQVTGVTYDGGFAPAVELRQFKDLGAMSPLPVRSITFDQAITGEEDGQMVYMRGFYQRTESDGDVRRIHVTTPAGEFVGLLKSAVNFEVTPGSLIQVRGACESVTDENGRITGMILRVPSLASVTVQEDAPADFYDLPLRPIKRLRQLSTARDLIRVRVAGVVLHAVPGRIVYLQQDDSGLTLLSHESTRLAPGDRIEAVGILGEEGVRTVLREAVYRKIGSGPPPVPARLETPARLSVALDSRLVSVRGILIDVVRRPGQPTRLALQAGNTLFEAVLDEPADAAAPLDFPLGAGLELTGIYRIGFDDSRQSRSFQLQLRAPQDVVVYQRARVWTEQRALTATAILGGCTLLGLAWVVALRRRVRRQTAQIREQLERQAQLEAGVQRAARLESLGVLAGGIAHDFNNLLTIIMGNLRLAMLDEKVMALAGDCLRDSERGAIRARDLTQQLLTFAKGGQPVRVTVSLAAIVRETTEFVLHGSNVRCDYDFGPELWSADVDKDQIAQVIQNLVINAIQATPMGGIVKISLRNEAIAPGARAGLAPGRYLKLAIADSGHGIKPEVLPRIFDPFFSTRKEGIGLGLATVYSIVKKHGGQIDVESTVDVGTTFTLWLPAAGLRAPDSSPSLSLAEASGSLTREKRARVLLMDDEESIRRLGAAVLQRIGLETTVVADGAEAVRVFTEARAAGRPFDLLILDLTIPGGMGGREASERIRALDPQVPAIVSSGYSNDPVLADFSRHGFQAMVAKPYEVTQLGNAIKPLLARRNGAA